MFSTKEDMLMAEYMMSNHWLSLDELDKYSNETEACKVNRSEAKLSVSRLCIN